MTLSKARNRDRMWDTRNNVQPKPGRPKGRWSIDDRLTFLEGVAHNGNTKQTNPVEAVKEYNRMTGAYPPIQHQVAGKVIFEVVYVDRRELQQPVVEQKLIEAYTDDESINKEGLEIPKP